MLSGWPPVRGPTENTTREPLLPQHRTPGPMPRTRACSAFSRSRCGRCDWTCGHRQKQVATQLIEPIAFGNAGRGAGVAPNLLSEVLAVAGVGNLRSWVVHIVRPWHVRGRGASGHWSRNDRGLVRRSALHMQHETKKTRKSGVGHLAREGHQAGAPNMGDGGSHFQTVMVQNTRTVELEASRARYQQRGDQSPFQSQPHEPHAASSLR